jgi:hypothetical protein
VTGLRQDAVIAELTAVAFQPGPLIARATALLPFLRELIGYDAVVIALLDPESGCHQPVIRHGYPPDAARHLDSAAFTDQIEADRPLVPGFRHGLVVPLHTADGRRLGFLGAHFHTPAPNTELLGAIAPLVAHAVDPRPSLTALTSLVTAPAAGIVLTRAGHTEPLPGLPGDPLLSPGSPALAEARAHLAAGAAHVTYLTRGTHLARREASLYVRVTVLATGDIPPGHRTGIVLLSAPDHLYDLTHHELTLLGLHLAGRRRRHINHQLRLPAHATIAMMETIRAKLGVGSRHKALLHAAAHGLYLPPA